jgi:hypothetical protein
MKRPRLREITLEEGIRLFGLPGSRSALMDVGQWDDVLQTVYDLGWTLFEVGANGLERVYRKRCLDPSPN